MPLPRTMKSASGAISASGATSASAACPTTPRPSTNSCPDGVGSPTQGLGRVGRGAGATARAGCAGTAAVGAGGGVSSTGAAPNAPSRSVAVEHGDELRSVADRGGASNVVTDAEVQDDGQDARVLGVPVAGYGRHGGNNDWNSAGTAAED